MFYLNITGCRLIAQFPLVRQTEQFLKAWQGDWVSLSLCLKRSLNKPQSTVMGNAAQLCLCCSPSSPSSKAVPPQARISPQLRSACCLHYLANWSFQKLHNCILYFPSSSLISVVSVSSQGQKFSTALPSVPHPTGSPCSPVLQIHPKFIRASIAAASALFMGVPTPALPCQGFLGVLGVNRDLRMGRDLSQIPRAASGGTDISQASRLWGKPRKLITASLEWPCCRACQLLILQKSLYK